MAGPPSYPANTNLTSNPPPPSISSQSNTAFTPSATSIADSSDNEYEPTPVHSPGGPQYEDLPPSYDEARDQANHDTRHGIAPVDPSQIEAHRITTNEGPNEPEIWEYRVRGEETDPASEQERAPDYANHTNDKATSVPVQHVSTSENIAVGRVHNEPASSSSKEKQSDLASDLLTQALEFSREEPDARAQYAPHLNRIIAIPEHAGPARRADEHVYFLVAYAEVLDRHSIKPAEFADFLYGLQVLTTAAHTTAEDLLHEPSHQGLSSSIVHDYIRGANEAFFAPRGLIVSFRSETALLDTLPIPAGHKPSVLANLADKTATAEWRARQLYPWIEALDADAVPLPSERVLKLHEMREHFSGPTTATGSPDYAGNSGLGSAGAHEDPPHSIPGPPEESSHAHGRHGRGAHHPRGRRGGHWSPFGMPGHGPFGAPGNGPFGQPGNGPFGRGGRGGPFGPRGNAFFGRGGCSPRGGRGRGRGPPQSANEWAEVGKELGKIGEQFGRHMGDLGVEIGKRASAFGVEVGRMAGGNVGGSGGGNAGASVSMSGNGGSTTSGPASYEQVHDDLPPAYAAPPGQETGVLYGDRKVDTGYPADTKDKGKAAVRDLDDDDDTSSLSSDSSDSDSDSSDSDYDYDPDSDFTPATTPKAQSLKLARRQIKQRNRQLKKDHKAKKRELKAKHSSLSTTEKSKGKGNATKKAKRDPKWKAAKKEYKAQRKELKKERLAVKKEWREAREEMKREKRGVKGMAAGGMSRGGVEKAGETGAGGKEGVWLVIENLAP
ncbi:hypothetical protein J4E83_008253 [Alternaria metachromatica]|uniref:uncharacterized protein n=1 Tax=Alternaria metachromatica TaxID=283354 RepID=UPI0020C4F15B|nr:uncharacterized protein J4E83_008253 [Alternaria metachromatica]KAI4610639.1 hypothetical protein J4E83_008253 [Alternaria metachromatica]